jgi:hypothetical protein
MSSSNALSLSEDRHVLPQRFVPPLPTACPCPRTALVILLVYCILILGLLDTSPIYASDGLAEPPKLCLVMILILNEHYIFC